LCEIRTCLPEFRIRSIWPGTRKQNRQTVADLLITSESGTNQQRR
jgi:hypothetical protein